ncbi:MAG: acyltransferase [Proteobacteria bacterium]|nr:acyltransferase [Pseudomonadota bacterium]
MHLKALDGVRGLAILLVLSDHLALATLDNPSWIGKLLQSGYLGVDLFFVLSGFLITLGLLKTREQPGYFRSFYLRRAARIMPLYYAVMILAVLFLIFVEPGRPPLDGYDNLAWPLTFTTNVAIALKMDWLLHSRYFVVDHFWTLAVEMQFYLVWPVLILWVRGKRLPIALVGIIALALASRFVADHYLGKWSYGAYLLTICRMDQFAIGGLLALLALAPVRPSAGLEKRIAVGFGALSALTIYLAIAGGGQLKPTVFALFFAFLMYFALTHPFARALFSNRILVHLGKYSYAMYVFHHLLYPTAQKYVLNGLLSELSLPAQQALYVVILLGFTYLLARISWVAIERPFLRSRVVLMDRGRAPAKASPQARGVARVSQVARKLLDDVSTFGR